MFIFSSQAVVSTLFAPAATTYKMYLLHKEHGVPFTKKISPKHQSNYVHRKKWGETSLHQSSIWLIYLLQNLRAILKTAVLVQYPVHCYLESLRVLAMPNNNSRQCRGTKQCRLVSFERRKKTNCIKIHRITIISHVRHRPKTDSSAPSSNLQKHISLDREGWLLYIDKMWEYLP